MLTMLTAITLALPAFLGGPHRAGDGPAGAWRVSVRRDRFDGAVSCRVSRRAAVYTPGAVVLRLPQGVDTSAAEYRVDGGAPYAAVHRLEALGPLPPDALHVALFNPSAGEVAVPEAQVLGARYVYVRPARHAASARFTVTGLAEALAQARSRGCGG